MPESALDDVTQQVLQEYMQKQRVSAGQETPLVNRLSAGGSPPFITEAVEKIQREGTRKPNEIPPEASGTSGWLGRTVGRPIKWVTQTLSPGWAEFSESWLVKQYLKDKPEYADWLAEKQADPLGTLVREKGFSAGVGEWLERYASMREKRPQAFWGEKVIGEILTDPTTYMGWGLAGKIPLAGKLLGPVMDTVPKSLWFQTFGRAARGYRSLAKSSLSQLDPRVAASYSNRELQGALQRILGPAAIRDQDTIASRRFVDLMTVALKGGGIPPELAKELEEITKRQLKKEDFDLLANVFQRFDKVQRKLEPAFENSDPLAPWLSSLGDMTPGEMIDSLMRGNTYAIIGARRASLDEVAKNSLAARTLFKFNDWATGPYTKWAIMEPAKALLVFSSYGPMNFVETAVRSALGGHFPGFVNKELFSHVYAGLPIPGGLADVKSPVGGDIFQGLEKSAKAIPETPELLAAVPGLKQVADKSMEWNGLFNNLGGDTLRSYYHQEVLAGLKAEITKRGIDKDPLWIAAQGAVKNIPKLGNRKLQKSYQQLVEYAALSGDLNLLETLPSYFTKGSIDTSAVREIFGTYGKSLHGVEREFLIDKVKKDGANAFRGAGLEKTRTELAERLIAKSNSQPEVLTDLMKVRLGALRDAVETGVMDFDALERALQSAGGEFATLDSWIENSVYGVIRTSRYFGTDAGKAYGLSGDWLERLGQGVEEIYQELDKLVQATEKNITDPITLDKAQSMRKYIRRQADEYAETRVDRKKIQDIFYPPDRPKESLGEIFDKEIKELVKGNADVVSKLPPKFQEILRREVNPPQSELALKGRAITKRPGVNYYNRPRSGEDAVTERELIRALHDSYQEAVDEVYIAHHDRTWGKPYVTPMGRTRYQPNEHVMGMLDKLVEPRPAVSVTEKAMERLVDLNNEALTRLDPTWRRQVDAQRMWAHPRHVQLQEEVDALLGKIGSTLSSRSLDDASKVLAGHMQSVTQAVGQMRSNPGLSNSLSESLLEATKRATESFKNNFTNYEDTTLLDSAMKMINPFWIYQSRSWPWLMGQAIQHPAGAEAFGPQGRYWEATDDGYIPVPIVGLQFSPIRGTIFGRLRRALRGPSPPRFSGVLGDIENRIDDAERLGFYPGMHLTIPLEIMGGLATGGSTEDIQSLLVESIPALPATAIEGLIAASSIAGDKWITTLAQNVFPSQFREYYMAKALWDAHRVAPSQAKARGHDDWIADAYRRVSLTQMVEQQLSATRFNPESWQKLKEQRSKMVTEITGLTEEQQNNIELSGKRLSEVISLNRIDRAKLQTLEGLQALSEATRPLSEGLRKEYLETMSDKYATIENLREGFLDDQENDDWKLEHGWIDPRGWRNNYYERWQEYRSNVESLGETEYFGRMGRTLTEQQAMREKLQMETDIQDPVDVVIDAMFSMEPEVNVWGDADWVGLFEAQEELMALLDTDTQARVRDYLNRFATPTMKAFREGREYMQDYWRVEESLPKWIESIGDKKTAEEIRLMFSQVRAEEAERWQSINQGVPIDIAKALSGTTSKRLHRYVEEYRWRIKEQDPRVSGYLKRFYGYE